MSTTPTNPYGSPVDPSPGQDFTYRAKTFTLKRLNVLSVAKIFGVLYALLGLILGGFFSLMAVAGVAAGGNDLAAGLIGGIGAVIIFPMLYGVLGFIGGAIGAALYNLCASLIGGLQFDLEG